MTSLQKRILVLFNGLLIIGCSKPVVDDESKYGGPAFAENIRNTPGHTPEEERQMLKVPEGFEIQLFASEPDIQKPLNIAFDSKGRMWVTQSFDYPFPAEPGKGTDHLTLVEDTNNDGKADKFTNFSDTLNIPIGVFPLEDGALTFSIPNIYRLTDNNKDGKADASKILYGPFGYEDTHGMVSNFMRGYDGWIHGSHGFTNNSKVSGSDHDSIHMISGNTYRFRIDGSRIEQMTFGQVNPFGIAYDEWGYVYTTDSHSSPLYQLITGGDYPHFGKLEIMAFGPDMKPLVNEATALCGIAYYGDTKFPKEFHGNLFIGDVINSRVHRYSSVNKGSSPIGKQEEALVKSADPWFRPVNVKLGPDGAIYVADFYNPIIGHYEVPLGHPLRDKNHGRIWRITYKGDAHKVDDISNAPAEQLIAKLDHDNIAVRLQATDQLTDRIGAAAVPLINELLANDKTSTRQYIHGLWILQRLHSLTPELIQKSAAHSNEQIRVHSMRILKEEAASPESQALALKGTQDSNPHVQRAAAEVLVAYADQSSVKALLAVLHTAPAEDTHLVYTCRLILRNLLRHEDLMKEVLAASWNPEETKWIAGTLVDVYSIPAGQFLAKNIDTNPLPPEKMGLAYQQIARFVSPGDLDAMLTRVMADQSKDVDERSSILKGVRQGIAQRGGNENPKFQKWGSAIAQELVKKYPAGNTEVSDDVANRQKLAFDLAGAYNVKELVPALGTYITAGGEARNDVKAAAFNALLKIEPASSVELAGKIIMDNSASLDLRKKVAQTLSSYPGSAVNKVLTDVKNIPPDLEVAVAVPLASTAEGKAILFKKIKAGEMAARTLRNARVRDRLMLNITPNEQKQYDELTANLGEVSAEKDALIADRLKAFKEAKLTPAQLDSGAMLFNNNCGVCHRRVSKDAIGPPLAGIGKRGDYALAEKILDPNRNITEAFRNYTIKMKDGKVFSGVYRRDEGAVAIYADLTGSEFSVVKKDITERKASPYTVMPDTFGSTLTQKEFNALLAVLLEW